MFNLKGKVALVTGGNGGIGLGIARGLARAGAGIAVVGHNADKNASAVKELEGLGVKAIGVVADVTDRKQVDRAVAETVAKLGGLDILVANAGTNIRKKPQDYTSEEWHQVVDTNLTSMFLCCQAAHPEMVKRGGGKVVTIGSMTSLFGFDVAPIYAATKGARQIIPTLHDKVVDRTPAKRWGVPEDFEGIAVFLCSDASDFVTGTAIPVDGGFYSSLF